MWYAVNLSPTQDDLDITPKPTGAVNDFIFDVVAARDLSCLSQNS
jgi:hypothetical protein